MLHFRKIDSTGVCYLVAADDVAPPRQALVVANHHMADIIDFVGVVLV